RTVAEDLQHDVRGREDRSTVRQDLRALLRVLIIRISRFDPGSRLEHDLQARLEQVGDDLGNEGNPTLPGVALLRDTDNHTVLSSGTDHLPPPIPPKTPPYLSISLPAPAKGARPPLVTVPPAFPLFALARLSRVYRQSSFR